MTQAGIATALQTAQQTAKPYKGMDSYRSEDADIFFGRDAEAELVAAKILASPFTLLHAQSGAGKTSLLNARVVPNLEATGSLPIIIRLQQDPVESIRTTVLLHLLPSPEVEIKAVRQLSELGVVPNDKISISEALRAFDALPVWDERRAILIRAVESRLQISGTSATAVGTSITMFARLLRSTLEINRYAAHLAAIGARVSKHFSNSCIVDQDTRLSRLVELLSDPQFQEAHKRELGILYVPQPELTIFFRQLFAVYGSLLPAFSIVLIFDQFEELFTLFAPALHSGADSGTSRGVWKLRSDFLMQLQTIYRAATFNSSNALVSGTAAKHEDFSDREAFPLKLVLSMRDEYIAHLDPLKSFIPNLDESAYHLTLLSRGQAREAIRKPAREFGYQYTEPCLTEIVTDLTKDDGLVEPAHLQLVCEKLWQVKGRQLSARALTSTDKDFNGIETGIEHLNSQLPQLSVETFNDLGRVRGILSSYLSGFLDSMNETDQQETLEMLEPLVTTARTRNIVEKDTITQVPYRDTGRREQLLGEMVNAKIVRIERRLGGNFVEIVHEFLIDGVLRQIRTRLLADGEHSRLRVALKDLATASTRRDRAILDRRSFEVLHDNRKSIVWDQVSSEIMTRSAIEHGKDEAVCAFWFTTLKDFDYYDENRIARLVENASPDSDLLSICELGLLPRFAHVDSLSLAADLLILKSFLAWADDSDVGEIRRWTKEVKND